MKKILATTALLLISANLHAETWTERTDWAKRLADQQLTGVVAVCTYPAGTCQTSDSTRLLTRYTPASTYKIPHLLIALDTGIAPAKNHVFKWDGKPQALKPWERDHTYRGLMQDSVVPVFQGFARQIGEQRMQEYLLRLNYGNADISGGIDRFWLDGGLRISAAEQIRFLNALSDNNLPISHPHQWRVRDAMLVEANEHFVLRGKTGYSLGMPGTGDTSKPGMGWWVGWIESGVQTHVFAANYDITSEAQLPLRKEIPRQIFLKEGWMGPAPSL